MFLGAVFHFEGRNTESVDMVNQRKAASASMDALVALWNELFEPMQVAHANAVPTDEVSVKNKYQSCIGSSSTATRPPPRRPQPP